MACRSTPRYRAPALPDGPVSRLTFDRARDILARWRPGSESVTFRSDRDGAGDLWSKRSDGVGEAELVLDLERDIGLGAWGPEGEWLVIRLTGRAGFFGERDIWAWRSSDDTEPQPLVATEFVEQAPAISPDGRWIAYSSDQTGEAEIYVERFPELGERQQVSTGGGVAPLWSPNGREIYYRRGDAMIAVPVDQGPPLSLGAPTVLFDGLVYQNPFGGRRYDISPDGTRFLMIKDEATADGAAPVNIRVVLNWTDELERLVPADN